MLASPAMERVTGIGGVFFKAKDPAALAEWYRANLGIDVVASFGGAIFSTAGETVWAPFPHDSTHFAKPFMINYRVGNLEGMLAQLRAAGAQVDEQVLAESNGKFGWATDPEGNRFELWEPAPAS
jgi:predicted enzyme related to lactoylglutathione lyase